MFRAIGRHSNQKFISLAQVVPGQYSLTVQDRGLNYPIFSFPFQVEELQSARRDMIVWMDSMDFRHILARKKSLRQLLHDKHIDMDRPEEALVDFFGFFELVDEDSESRR